MPKFREDLQILRGFAVLIVLFYHLKIAGFDRGYLGVDLFFVLSGYLMARLSTKYSVFEFYKRRFYRLVPAYLFTIFVTSFVIIILTVPSDADQHFDRIWLDLFGLSNIGFWLENSYFNSTAFKPLLNFWSLGVEIQFYILAPFLLPFLRKRILILITLIVLSITLSLFVLTISPKTSFFMLPTRIWEFLIGATVSWYSINKLSENKKKLISYSSLIVLLFIIFFYPIKDDSPDALFGHPGIASIFVVISTGLLISTGLDYFLRSETLVGKIMSNLGNYSYSIYLSHFPIIVLINYVPFGGTIIGSENIIKLILILSLTAAFSYLMYNYVEKIRYQRKKFSNYSIPLLSLAIIVIFGSKLVSIKFTEKQNLIFDAWKDRSNYRCGKLSRILSPFDSFCQINSKKYESRVLLLGNSHADSIKMAFSSCLKLSTT